MKLLYDPNLVYVVVNSDGMFKSLIGTECRVTATTVTYNDGKLGQETDIVLHGLTMFALAGALRPKNPPSGERLINEMFDVKDFCHG